MRLMKTKSKNSTCFFVIKDVTVNNKRTTKIVKKLGSLNSLMKEMDSDESEVLIWANEHIATLNKKEKENNSTVIVKFEQSKQIAMNTRVSFNGGYLFLQDILYDLKINKICDEIASKYKFDFNLTDILSKLIYTRILYPSSKFSSFESSKALIEKPSFDVHQIYRALAIISKEKEFIEDEIYKNSTAVIQRDTTVLYYDCTNFFFETEEAECLKQYGKSNEHRPNPIVQMGLFMDGNGIPLSFCINPRNDNDQKSLIALEKNIINDFDISKFIVCTDEGLASQQNIIFNTRSKRSYIVTQSLKKMKKYLIDWALNPNDWKLSKHGNSININEIDDEIYKDKVFYKERLINENGFEQRMIVSFSPKYKAHQRNVATTTALSLNEDSINKEEMFDGFYVVYTTLEYDIEDVIKINKGRCEIEESFKIIKTEFKSRPLYVSKDERIIAHFTTCFLSLLVYRILEKKLNNKYTTKEIISTLQEMNFHEIKGDGYIPTYIRTDLTDALHDTFGFRTDQQIVSEKNMKKIIKQTTK